MIPHHIKLSDVGQIYMVSNAANISRQLHQIASRAMLGTVPNFINQEKGKLNPNSIDNSIGAVSAQTRANLSEVL